MANTISAIKRDRQTERRTAVNVARKSRFRHQVRTFRKLLERREVGHYQEEHRRPLQVPGRPPFAGSRRGIGRCSVPAG
jgi:hypothetical protein